MTTTRPTQQAPRRAGLGLLDLPLEVRHEIYRHLFCIKPSPITLGHQDYFKWSSLSLASDSHDPTFHTALFRVNRAISEDTVHFAYSANTFRFEKDTETFCNLSRTALNSIKILRVYKNTWLDSALAARFWQTMQDACSSLELLIVESAWHILLSSIPYAADFMASIPNGKRKPCVVLDLNVWDRHFSFDIPDCEYRSAREDLRLRTRRWNDVYATQSQSYMTRLPKQAREIRFVMDTGPGAFRALEEALRRDGDLPFVRVDNATALGGDTGLRRGRRYCYVWKEPATEERNATTRD